MELNREEKAKLGELLVSLRDHHQGAATAIDGYLNYLAQNEIQETNVGNITWQAKQGSKGPYEMATRELAYARDYDLLEKELREHDGKMQKGAYFFWLFDRQDAIGRKPSRK